MQNSKGYAEVQTIYFQEEVCSTTRGKLHYFFVHIYNIYTNKEKNHLYKVNAKIED